MAAVAPPPLSIEVMYWASIWVAVLVWLTALPVAFELLLMLATANPAHSGPGVPCALADAPSGVTVTPLHGWWRFVWILQACMVFLSGRFCVITIVIDLFCPCGALRPAGMAKAPVVNTLLKRHRCSPSSDSKHLRRFPGQAPSKCHSCVSNPTNKAGMFIHSVM